MASTSHGGADADPPDAEPGRLADLEAIRDLARTYAHRVWRKDVAGVVDVFTDDAHVDLGTVAPVQGRAAVTAAYEQALGAGEFLPFVHQHVVDLRGDTATGTCYVQVWGTIDGEKVLIGGYYDDHYRRTGDGWKISSRTINLLPYIPLGPQRPHDPED
ncbi:MAG: nuclear transport factor 2 family protein [Acidimicrobiia bacterium]